MKALFPDAVFEDLRRASEPERPPGVISPENAIALVMRQWFDSFRDVYARRVVNVAPEEARLAVEQNAFRAMESFRRLEDYLISLYGEQAVRGPKQSDLEDTGPVVERKRNAYYEAAQSVLETEEAVEVLLHTMADHKTVVACLEQLPRRGDDSPAMRHSIRCSFAFSCVLMAATWKLPHDKETTRELARISREECLQAWGALKKSAPRFEVVEDEEGSPVEEHDS